MASASPTTGGMPGPWARTAAVSPLYPGCASGVPEGEASPGFRLETGRGPGPAQNAGPRITAFMKRSWVPSAYPR
jgi:hypothetical protein